MNENTTVEEAGHFINVQNKETALLQTVIQLTT